MRTKELFVKESNVRVAAQPVTASGDPLLHGMMSHYFNTLMEASSAMDMVRQSPYADRLIKNMHGTFAIAHDINWEKIPSITWNEVKEVAPNFVLISGSKGTAVIRYSGGDYYAMVADGDEGINTFKDSASAPVMKFIKERIGKTTGFWLSQGTGGKSTRYRSYRSGRRTASHGSAGSVETLRGERAKHLEKDTTMLDPEAEYNQNVPALIKKLRPLFLRYIQHAIADIKGAAAIAMKNDAYSKAINKMQLANTLTTVYDGLSESGQIPEYIESKIIYAVYLTASHFYPDETGNINAGARYGRSYPTTSNIEGPRKVIKDIASGDAQKLAAVMTYFKRSLLHGGR